MRLDIYLKTNISSLIENKSDFSNSEKKDVLSLPRSFWQKEIREGNILISGKKSKPSASINGKEIKINWKKTKRSWNENYKKSLLPYPLHLNVISGDKVISINKPAGISVHPSFPINSKVRSVTLIEGVVYSYPNILKANRESERPGVVHRLDKNTSGAILFASSKTEASRLKRQFKNRVIQKIYYALIEENFPYNYFCIESQIGKNSKSPLEQKSYQQRLSAIDEDSSSIFSEKPEVSLKSKKEFMKNYNFQKISNSKAAINPKTAITFGKKIAHGNLAELKGKFSFSDTWINILQSKVANNKNTFSLIQLVPYTGRKHQLRVQLSSLDFPVVGDSIYRRKYFIDLGFHCLHSAQISWKNSANKWEITRANEFFCF